MPPLSRNERLILAAITATGLALRAEGLGELSLAHFDEGVLMSSAFDVRLKGLWQFTLAQPLQSPPLYPWLVSGLMWLTGFDSPQIGVYASALFGSATIPLFFLLARRSGGNRFGLVAAAFLATSDLHIAFSRMALTEAALTFWFVLAIYAFSRLVEACTRSTAPKKAQGHASAMTAMAPRQPTMAVAYWTILAGLGTAAAWNTKYNGWMPLAIVATGCFIRWLGQRLPGGRAEIPLPPTVTASAPAERGSSLVTKAATDCIDRDEPYRWSRVSWALFIAGAIAVVCFLPWYRYVERTLPGGYAAVTRNHLNYVGGLAEWPRRATRLFVSLSAFRHFGWALIIGALLAALVWQTAMASKRRATHSADRLTTPSVILAAVCIAAAAIIGTDAMYLVIATAAIVPALIWGRLEQIVLAVWVGSFVVVTPFYHPYTRLLVPAVPGAIGLTLWAVLILYRPRPLPLDDRAPLANVAQNRLSLREKIDISLERKATLSHGCFEAPANKTVTGCLVFATVAVVVAAIFVHPFGWLPGKALWQRWSTRQSYRAFGEAVREQTPSDAHILCQGMPIMPLYLERRWDSLGHVPFTAWIDRVPDDRPCFLAVDFWGLYGEHHEAARQAMADQLDCFEPVTWVENDLNLVTLLDYLTPAEAARRISQVWPTRSWRDSRGREVTVPAPPGDAGANLIVLYRIHRNRIRATR